MEAKLKVESVCSRSHKAGEIQGEDGVAWGSQELPDFCRRVPASSNSFKKAPGTQHKLGRLELRPIQMPVAWTPLQMHHAQDLSIVNGNCARRSVPLVVVPALNAQQSWQLFQFGCLELCSGVTCTMGD